MYFVKVALVDTIMASTLLYFFINKIDSYNGYVLAAALLGAWLPDFANVAGWGLGIKRFLWWSKIVYIKI